MIKEKDNKTVLNAKESKRLKQQAQQAQLAKLGLSSELIDSLFNLKRDRSSRRCFDELVKQMLYIPAAAKELIEAFFPKEFVQQLSLSSLNQMPTEFTGLRLERLSVDTLLHVETREGEPGYLIHIEHQSSADESMPLRLNNYHSAILLRLWRSQKKQLKQLTATGDIKPYFPDIKTLVLYHGPSPYPFSSENFYKLFANQTLKQQRHWGDFILVDLKAVRDDKLLIDRHCGYLLSLLKYDLSADYLLFLAQLRERVGLGCGITPLDWEPIYIFITKALTKESAEDFLEALYTIIDSEIIRRKSMNYYQYIQQQGEQRGELRGEQRGFKKGEQSGLKKGEQKAKQAIAKTLLKQGVSTQIIATAAGLDEQSLQALKTKGSNSAAQITENSEE